MTMLKIITIDDDPIVRTLIKKTFNSLGFEVITAADGFEGLQAVIDNHPDVIFLDIMMLIIDGIEVLKRIKATPEIANIPVIMFTAVSEGEMVADKTKIGAEEYIIKQFQSSVLIQKVNELLKDKYRKSINQ